MFYNVLNFYKTVTNNNKKPPRYPGFIWEKNNELYQVSQWKEDIQLKLLEMQVNTTNHMQS